MNKNRKVMIKKSLQMSLSAALVLTSVAGCSVNRPSEVEKPDDTMVATTNTAAPGTVISHGSTEGKNETVYVMAEADGSVEKTIVSNWLSNPSELTEIKDLSNLKDIVNVKGDETFEIDKDGNLVWKADGKDIYYQGTTQQELPVTVHIAYQLDGKDITPEALAGKSGKLTMTFTYTNHVSKEVEIQGKKETIYQPFAVISGVAFDNKKVSHVTVTNGKAINDGEHTAVVGFALPGLNDSLKLDDLKVNGETVDVTIPESVVITADVEDFSLLTSLTIVDNRLLKQIRTDENGSWDLSGLSDSLREMTDASTKLVGGSSDLYDGTVQLLDGVSTLDEGAGSLADGATQLHTGAGALADGATKLEAGAQTLKAGISKADEGAGALQEGAGQLSSGLGQLDAGVDQLVAGADQLDGGLAQLQTQTAELPDGVDSLLSGLKTIKVALKSGDLSSPKTYGIYEAASVAAAGCDQVMNGLKSGNSQDPTKFGIYEAAAAVEAGLGSVGTQLTTAANSLAAQEEASAYYYDAQAALAIQAVLQGGGLNEAQQQTLQKALQCIQGSQQYETTVAAALQQVDTSDAVTALEGIKSGAEQLVAGVSQIKTADQGIATGIDTIISGNKGNNLTTAIAGVETMSASAQQLVQGVGALKAGATQLSTGLHSVDTSMPALVGGAAALTQGAGSLKDGTAQLVTGSGTLAAGTSELKNGVTTLVQGAGTLADGAEQLHEGTGKLKDGATTLRDGAQTLADGMQQFDEQAVQKLSDLLNTDLTGVADRLKAVMEYADEYKTFSGAVDGAETGVKFIIRTDAIEKKD